MDSNADLYNTSAAADWLNKAIPGRSPEYWRNQLINNRRKDRTQLHPIPFSMIGKLAVYTLPALEDFVEFENSRRMTGVIKHTDRVAEIIEGFGMNGTGGHVTGTGRKLEYSINELDEPANGGGTERIVQLITSNPLRAWRLTSQEAAKLAQDLLDALKPRQYEPAEYVTVSDTPDALVQRRIEKQTKS